MKIKALKASSTEAGAKKNSPVEIQKSKIEQTKQNSRKSKSKKRKVKKPGQLKFKNQ